MPVMRARDRWILLTLLYITGFGWRDYNDSRPAALAQRPPNFIVVYADDMGYADIGSFSTRTDAGRPSTPNLDRMAAEGIRFTDFYVAQAVCSASRTALLTGCYPNRVGIHGALNHQPSTASTTNETTIAEVLKPRGYATAIYGKWHLGHRRSSCPRVTASTSTSACPTRTTCGRSIRNRRTSIPTCR